MFIVALFIIARTWKQPKCPFTEEWIKKMWYIYTIEYYTENIILSEVIQTQKDKNNMYSLIRDFWT